ncbi:unnamed protein product [Calypogeia fissa]
MAYEVCSQSLRTMGAAGGGVGVVSAAATGVGTRSSGSAVADCFSFRRSWSPPTHGDFGVGKSLKTARQGGAQFARDTPLPPRVAANPFVYESFGVFGALTRTQDGVPEKPCAQQPAGPGSSTLEKWLERYLTEIVKHLPEAPFLQFVPKYNSINGERQRVSEDLFKKPESWTSVKECLLESAPDGIILVHRLDQEALSECNEVNTSDEELSRPSTSLQAGGSSTDVWGVLVQGCRTRCNACYILKTTQVASSTGILTHFCLSRAKCFGPSLKSQLQSTWLL